MGTDPDGRLADLDRPGAGAAEAVARAEAEAEVPEHARHGTSERLMVVLLCVAIGVAVLFMGWYVREHANTLLPRAVQPLAQKIGMMRKPPMMDLSEPVGSPTAKVRALVVMEHCLEPVQDLLVQIGTTYPDQVRAEFVSMYGPEGQKAMAEHGESCAGVYVNDKNRFQVTVDGQESEVYLHGLPGGGYRLSHIAAVVKQEIVAAYGSAPADFDARIVVVEGPMPMGAPAGFGASMGMPPAGGGPGGPGAPPGARPAGGSE